MFTCEFPTASPASYLTCGNLVNENDFLHPSRTMDFFVLIVIKEGTLHICQDGVHYDVHPGEFFLLLPGLPHYGFKPSNGRLSYYWAHFTLEYWKCSKMPESFSRLDSAGQAKPSLVSLPVHGRLSGEKRSLLLFVQLLDLARRSGYRRTLQCQYALNLLLLELSEEYQQAEHLSRSPIPAAIMDIMEWIQSHFDQTLSVAGIARTFGYHPTYLSAVIKKYTGEPLVTYISRTRIQAAKNLLSSYTLTIRQISEMCGFADEKNFMKLFKRFEGLTPSQYRKAFHQKKVNTI